jgi:hypothetical protein
MHRKILSAVFTNEHRYSTPLLVVDAVLTGTLFFLPNMLMGASLLDPFPQHNDMQMSGRWLDQLEFFLRSMDLQNLLLWGIANLSLTILLFALRRHIFYPMFGMMRQLRSFIGAITPEASAPRNNLVSMRSLAGDMTRMAAIAQDYFIKHRDANAALVHAQGILSQINAQQDIILNSTRREMVTQYQSVLAYANYLEEHIKRHTINPDLRYDFDEVSESSFNLKLIAGALNLIQLQHPHQAESLDVPLLMQQTMLALAPSLDRRAMKLTTIEVDLDVMAQSDPAIIAHVLWMMLLGTIRYAADESTLRLRCLYNRDRTRTLISIVVSELSPGRMSQEERGAFLARELQHLTPHMFAETIRIHANMQLAQMLMTEGDGTISIVPLTSYSCEICLNLPAAKQMS